MIKNVGTIEVIIILVIIVILFGSKKLPEFIKGIAISIREFRNSLKSKEDENQ